MPRRGVRSPGFAFAFWTVFALATAAPRRARALDSSRDISQYVMRSWRESEGGLPQNVVAALAQDRDGYLWAGTQQGLARFDGVRFVTFDPGNTPAMKAGDIDALLVDARSGALWVGTRGGGLTRLGPGDAPAATFTTAEGLGHDFVLSLAQSEDGAIWVGTRGGGVARLDPASGKPSAFHKKDGLPDETVSALLVRRDGSVLAGTEKGLARRARDGAAFERLYASKDGLPRDSVTALAEGRDGTLWIGTPGGLARVAPDGRMEVVTGAKTKTSSRVLSDASVTSLLVDHEGNVWVGTDAGGVNRVDPSGGVTSFRGRGDQSFQSSHAFLEDREGSLWIGTDDIGIVRLRDGALTPYTTEEGLLSNNVWSVYEDPGGRVWAGTREGGLHRLDENTRRFVPIVSPDALGKTLVMALEHATGGGLWVGMDGSGLRLVENGRVTRVLDVHHGTLPHDNVRSLYLDHGGTLWIGTMGNGLSRITPNGELVGIGVADGFPNMVSTWITEAKDGRTLWVGTDGGGLVELSLPDAHVRKVWTQASGGLASDMIQSLAFDEDGSLWVATYGGGLNLLKDGTVTSLRSRQGLHDDGLLLVLDDRRGSLWMTSNRGIFRAERASILAAMGGGRLESVAYGPSDGMLTSECNGGSPGGMRSRDGRLWFATAKGLIVAEPARLGVAAPPLATRLEGVRANGVPTALGDRAELAPGNEDLEFEYTAPSFVAPERVRFRYRLQGHDRDWVDAGARRTAFYTSLPPGSYRFEVSAALADGVWGAPATTTQFRLKPRLYQTVPFAAGMVILVAAIVASGVRLRIRALAARARALEEKVRERTLELSQALGTLAEKDVRLDADLRQAREFQQRILPKVRDRTWSVPVDVAAVYEPAELVGGDLFDVCEPRPGVLRFFLADTTGHGVQASLRTIALKTELDALKLGASGPADLLRALNRRLVGSYRELELRCSACCFDVSAEEGTPGAMRVRYANAAHPPLLVARAANRAIEEVYERGTFVGMIEEGAFGEVSVELAPGDVLVAYTDGICEQEGPANGKGEAAVFGLERLGAVVLATLGGTATEHVASVRRAFADFRLERPVDDDVTLLALVAPGPEGAVTSPEA